MNKTKSFKELKRMSRLQMQGKMGTLIGAMVLYLLISMVISEIISRVISGSDLASTIILHVISFITELILATIVAGLSYLHLNVACNNEIKISDIFYVAKNHPDKAIKLQAFISIINLILSAPTYMYSYKYGYKFINYYVHLMNSIMESQLTNSVPVIDTDILGILGVNFNVLMIYCIAIIVCSIAIYIISIGFYPIFFLMLDFPQMEATEVLKKSWALMKGYKFRFFLLQLSFLPYFILSAFTFCIPLIWVIPYIKMANTNFYLDLIAVKHGSANTEN